MFLRLAFVTALTSLGLCATYDTIKDVPKLEWDFIIVGGGTAGSVLASRLTENPRFNVLVIEAGPTNENVTESIIPRLGGRHTALTRLDWNFTTVPQKGLNGRVINLQRGHILGGSSSVNGMAYTRGSSSDFDRFARVTNDPGWSWDKLQPYIRRNEMFEAPVDNHDIEGQFDPKVHSSTGRVPVTLPGFLSPAIDSAILQASREVGGDFQFNVDTNSGTPLGLGWLQSTIGHDGTRSGAATSYLDAQTKSRENLHIVVNTRVTRVLKTSGTRGLTIRTVEIRSPDSLDAVLLTASKEVILAGGSIGTPHILLHSGIGDQNVLRAFNISTVLHNPSVGRNLTDHTALFITFGLAPNSIDLGPWTNLDSDPALQARALELWNANRTGPYVLFVPTYHVAWTRLPDDSPVIKRFGDPSSGQNSAHLEFIFGVNGGRYTAILFIVSPASRGSVSIGSSNPLDDPLIDPGYYTSEFDLLATREGIEKAKMFTKAPVWKDIITGFVGPLANATTDAEIDDIVRNNTGSGLHPVGTAAMSPKNSNWGVVDPDLLVKKVSGLRIVDASVMPYIPCAHTQAPVYIIAERAADMIKSTWYDYDMYSVQILSRVASHFASLFAFFAAP